MKKSTRTWLIVIVIAAIAYFFWTPIKTFFSGLMAKFSGSASTSSATGATTGASTIID